MVTDVVPEKGPRRAEHVRSDAMRTMELPDDNRFLAAAKSIEDALKTEATPPVRIACMAFLGLASEFYGVSTPQVRVLRARPIRVLEGGRGMELFGDYRFDERLIRVWMRTAIQKRVTSFGTFLATLCHEFCHHLDRERFGFLATPHTRGFYERTAALYHHARATPARRLFWSPYGSGRWRINWPRTNRGE